MSVFAFFGINPSTAEGDCVLSPCGTYRYRLDRSMADKPSDEDQTTMKWRGFTVRNGGCRYIVGNWYAYRSTNVKALATVADPVGPENYWHLRRIIAEADVLVPCWGDLGKVPKELRDGPRTLLAWLTNTGKPVLTFGVTKGGDPRHPLMLGYATPLIPWDGPTGSARSEATGRVKEKDLSVTRAAVAESAAPVAPPRGDGEKR